MSVHRIARRALAALLLVLAAACGGGQKVTSMHLLGDIEATVIAASGEAAVYVPDQLAAVQQRLAELKAEYARQDYAAVLSGAPDVLGAAQALATAAAAKKDETLQALNDDWAALAVAVPSYVTALRDRIDELAKPAAKARASSRLKPPPVAVDMAAAKAALTEAGALWSKAQGAFAAGNLKEAVSTAQAVKTKLQALAVELKLQLPEVA